MPGLHRQDARDLLRAVGRVKSTGETSERKFRNRPGDGRFKNIHAHVKQSKAKWKAQGYDQKVESDDHLQGVVNQYLDAHSHRVYTAYFNEQNKLCRKYTRVFPPGTVIKADVDASFISGIHMFRGALKLAEYAGVDESTNKDLREAMSIFRDRMKRLATEYAKVKESDPEKAQEILKIAAKQTLKFNSCLAGIFEEAGVKKPFKGMKLMKDFFLKKARHEEASCTVIEVPGKGFTFSYAKSMTLDAENSLWDEYKSGDASESKAFWVKQLKKKHPGKWLDKFVSKNLLALKTIPRTPMTTDIPGPGNAFDNTIFSIDTAGAIKQISHSVITSTTEPFSLMEIGSVLKTKKLKDRPNHKKAETEKARLTANTHELLFGEDRRMKGMVSAYADKWSLSDSVKDKPAVLVIPIFDQNLIADLGPIPGKSDAGKSRNTLKHKALANKALMEKFKKNPMYLNVNDPSDVRNEAEYQKLPPKEQGNYRQVMFQMVESNRGINMWWFCTRTDNAGAEKLLAFAEKKIEGDLAKVHPKESATILEYLKSKHRMSVGSSEYNEAKQAAEKIINNLEGDINQENYKSLLYSSLELRHVIYQSPVDELARLIMKNRAFEFLHGLYGAPVGYVFNFALIGLACAALAGGAPATLLVLTVMFSHVAIRSSQTMPSFGALMLLGAVSTPILLACSGIPSMLAPLSLGVIVSAIPVVGQVILLAVAISVALYIGYNIVKQWGKERSILSKARCEGELGSVLGVAAPKCASSCDRGLEMLMQRVLAQVKSVFGVKPDMVFLAGIKRNLLALATGTPIAKDKETRGIGLKSSGFVSAHDDSTTKRADSDMGKQREGGLAKDGRFIKDKITLSLKEYRDNIGKNKKANKEEKLSEVPDDASDYRSLSGGPSGSSA